MTTMLILGAPYYNLVHTIIIFDAGFITLPEDTALHEDVALCAQVGNILLDINDQL